MNGIPEYGTGRHEDYLTWLDEQRAAGVPDPDNAEVAYEQWIAERNPADVGSNAGFTAGWRAAIAVAGGWPLCPNGCGCRLGAEDADQRDCACDGLCCYDEVEVGEVFAERDRLRKQLAIASGALTEFSNGGHGDLAALDAQQALDGIAALEARTA